MTYEEIANRLVEDVDQLAREADYVYKNIVLPNWDSQPRRYWNTLYGLIMVTFATIDLASLYWEGTKGKQTDRMRRFMDRFVSPDTEANDVALQMWRHSLMHTGRPRYLLDQRTQVRYRWLLHWSSDKLAPLHHFSFEGTGPDRKLNLTLIDLIDAVGSGIKKYTEELANDRSMQQNCLAAHGQIELQTFQSRP